MNARVPSTAMIATEPAHPAVAGISTGAVLAIVPQTFDDVYRFAQVLARSGLCPFGMDTPDKVAVAILTGLEIGVKPMQAVQGIAVIGGRPCVWGDLALGIVRAAGTLEYIRETYEGNENACDWTATRPDGAMLDFKAVCRIKRKGEPEHVTEFSVRDAVVAKLWGKRGQSGRETPWITNPKRMLRMRARGFALRDTHADVLKGMLVAEELIGTDADTAFDPAPPPPPPPPAPENLLPPAPPPPPSPVPNIAPVEEALWDQARREAELLQTTPKREEPRVVDEPVGEPEEEPVTMESLLAELDEKLGFQKTAEEIEEAYTNFDAEPLLSDYEGGVEAARNMKTRHLYRVGAGNVPLSERKPAPLPELTEAVANLPAAEAEMLRESGALPADDFPGNAAIETAKKAAEDPEAAMRAYKERLVAVLNDATTTDEVEKFWADTAEEREALGAPEAVRLRWKAAKQQAVAAIRDGL